MLIRKQCPLCGKVTYLNVSHEMKCEYEDYICYGGMIQDKLKSFDKFGREFCKTGYCPSCQEKLFSSKLKDKSGYFYLDELRLDVMEKFMENTEEFNCEEAIISEYANILSREEKLVFLHDFDMEVEYELNSDNKVVLKEQMRLLLQFSNKSLLALVGFCYRDVCSF